MDAKTKETVLDWLHEISYILDGEGMLSPKDEDVMAAIRQLVQEPQA